MFVDFHILNELGSPSINSNTFANRPPAGQLGRLFVSTDTFEIYRDNGTTWDLIGGPGSSTITGTGTATQVAYFTSSQAIGSSANLFWDNTNTRLGIGTNTPSSALDIHSNGVMARLNSTSATANSLLAFQRSGSGLWRIGDNYNGGLNQFEIHNTVLGIDAVNIKAATNKTIWQATENYTSGVARGNYFDYNLSLNPASPLASPNAISALGASLDLTLQGSITIPSGARSGLDAYNSISFTGTGTLTHNQGTQIRAYSNVTAGWAFNGSATGTITHLAGLRALFPDNSGSAVTITNNYALLLNDQTANTGTVTYTNRWGVYQEGSSDLNYFAANTLIGTTVNSGYKLDVNGTGRFSGNLTNNINAVDTSQLTLINNNAGTQFTHIGNFAGNTYISTNWYFLGGAIYDDPTKNSSSLVLNGDGTIDINTANAGSTPPTTKIKVSATGLVGIGTTTPAFKLDVNGTVSNLSNRIFGTNGLAGYLLQQGDWLGTAATNLSIAAETGNGLSFFTNGSGTVRAFIPTSGNFLIGTTTDAGQKLQVNGDIKGQLFNTGNVLENFPNPGQQYNIFAGALNEGIYLIRAQNIQVLPQPNDDCSACMIVVDTYGNIIYTPFINNGNNITLTVGANNVTMAWTGGNSNLIYSSYTRLG